MAVASRIRGLLSGGLRRANKKSSAISDERFATTLGAYAGMVARVLDQPEHWLGAGPEPSTRNAATRALRAVGHLAFGETHPGSSGWSDLPLRKRTRWWLRRISVTAGSAAAAPRVAGLLADRVPLQAALGASASGLAVCATARENGVDDPAAWVPLLATVIFDRDLSSVDASTPDAAVSESALAAGADESDDADDPDDPDDSDGRSHRAVRGMWHLARTLLELQGLFDERPHGNLLARALARAPVVGVLGGWIDERGGIAAASRETQALLDERAPAGG